MSKQATKEKKNKKTDSILNDYKLVCMSREMSLLGRKEVLTGKAKFGIFGDGKELPQLALSKHFKNGDFRSGYYRDQTIMMAIGELTVEQFFAQLYANPDVDKDPNSGGRQMNAHFATRLIDEEGNWVDQTAQKNTSADMSPTAGQMARLLGLAQASKVYRENDLLSDWKQFSDNGNEVAWGTIGDASTSEGIFWETINAAGVLQVPMVISVWDDGYGISVSKKYQTTKESISTVLRGFKRTKKQPGFEIINVKAWDYQALLDAYAEASKIAREEHVPVLVHVEEVTQPQGHSTSGSHERYKDEDRLNWEEEYCCINQFRQWIEKEKMAEAEELDQIEEEAKKEVREAQKKAWNEYQDPIKQQKDEMLALLDSLISNHNDVSKLEEIKKGLDRKNNVIRKDVISTGRQALFALRGKKSGAKSDLVKWLDHQQEENQQRFNSHLLSDTPNSPLKVEEVKPSYSDDAKNVDGRVVLRDNFDKIFEKYPNALVFGEDVGQLGDVNLGLEDMQEKYGELRVSDTGIREATILGRVSECR
jgi:2-oxoisovalerate dehydrogenase E1 component